MVTVTTEHGSFAADTVKDAARLARAAKRKAAHDAAREAEVHRTSGTNARDVGYRVYCHTMDTRRRDRWEVLLPGSRFFPSRGPNDRLVFHSPSGSGDFMLERTHKVLGVVWDAAGFHVCVFLQVQDETFPPGAYAIGIHEGVMSLAELPGVTMNQFNRETDNAHTA